MAASNVLSATRKGLTGKLSSSKFLILLLFILFLPLVVPAAPAALSDEAQTCLTCHASPGTKTFGDKTTVSVQVDGGRFGRSVHGPLGCTSCHSRREARQPSLGAIRHEAAIRAARREGLQDLP